MIHERCAYSTGTAPCEVRGREKPHTHHICGTDRIIPGEFYGPVHWDMYTEKTKQKFCRDYRQIHNYSLDVMSGDGSGSGHQTTWDVGDRILDYRRNQGNHGIFKNIFTNKTCLVCLQGVPDHVLSCKHAYCALCIQELAQPSQVADCAWTISRCLLCDESVGDTQGQLVRLKPRCAGVRILTLDGGGVRGVVELAIISRLEKYIGLKLPFNTFFDLIVGTSTGKCGLGIIWSKT